MPNDMLPDEISLEGLHTLQTDGAQKIKEEQISKASLLVEQEKVRERVVVAPVPPADSHIFKNIFFTALTALVIAAAGYGILQIANERSRALPVTESDDKPAQQELVIFNTTKELSFSDEEKKNAASLGEKLRSDTTTDSEGVTFFKTNTSLLEIISILSPSIPTDLQRTLQAKSFYGRLPQGNFFILKTDSYERAYARTLEWETSMQDILPLFALPADVMIESFEDKIVGNRDTRVAMDRKGAPLLFYGFYGTDTIIFARNDEVYKAVYEMLLRQNI